MPAPIDLIAALNALDAPAGIARAIDRIQIRYRQDGISEGSPGMMDDKDRNAYVHVRMPATAAAIRAAMLMALEAGAPRPDSLLDLGSGPGTALWAAAECLPTLAAATAIERDRNLQELGRSLWGNRQMPTVAWKQGDLRDPETIPVHDWTVISYALNELDDGQQDRLVDHSWTNTAQLLLLIEPGTPRGAAIIRRHRQRLTARGAHVIAPCGHEAPCPLHDREADGDTPGHGWCRFSTRLDRTRIHRQAKGGSLGHEDEPFSMVALTRKKDRPSDPRIIAPPKTRHDGIGLRRCSSAGVDDITIGRRDSRWREARKASWGDLWPEIPT